MTLTLKMLEEKYPQADWTHIYTGSLAEDAVRNGGSGVFVRTPTGQTVSYSNATSRKCSNFKAETSALKKAVACIAEVKPQKTVILTDSKAALQSLISNAPDQPIHCWKTRSFSHMNVPWSYCGSKPTMGFQEMKEQITGPSLGANNCNPCPPPLTRKQNPAPKQSKMPIEKGHRRLQPLYRPKQPSGKTWADHYIQLANMTLWPARAPEVKWHHGLSTLQLQRSRTDDPPGLFHLAETETPVMAAGWVNHQQAEGNGRRPVLHHPIPGNMWTEGLSMSDQLQKKKIKKTATHTQISLDSRRYS